MTKYVVEAACQIQDGLDVGKAIFITGDPHEADAVAVKLFASLKKGDEYTTFIRVGSVNEEDLAESDNWYSYKKIEVIRALAHGYRPSPMTGVFEYR